MAGLTFGDYIDDNLGTGSENKAGRKRSLFGARPVVVLFTRAETSYLVCRSRCRSVCFRHLIENNAASGENTGKLIPCILIHMIRQRYSSYPFATPMSCDAIGSFSSRKKSLRRVGDQLRSASSSDPQFFVWECSSSVPRRILSFDYYYCIAFMMSQQTKFNPPPPFFFHYLFFFFFGRRSSPISCVLLSISLGRVGAKN